MKELLEKLFKAGAAIRVTRAGLVTLAVAELHPAGLFFIGIFPEDQHHAHCLPFEEMEANGEIGISFLSGKELVAYITSFDEWPELDTDDAFTERARWQQYLKNKRNREGFERFTNDMRQQLT